MTEPSRQWLAIAMLGCLFVQDAEARFFRRLFGGFFRGGPVFERRQWSTQPRQGGCCSPSQRRIQNVPGQNGVVSNNNNRRTTFADQAFGVNFKELDGFSKIVQSGNAIIERAFFLDPRDGRMKFQFRPLQIQDNGVLVGASNLDTVSELVRFYSANREKFRGEAGNRVNNFLQRYGGFSNGQFVFNMNVGLGVDEKEYSKLRRCNPAAGGAQDARATPPVSSDEIATAALTFMLNDVSQSSGLISGLRMSVRDGLRKEVGVNLAPFYRQDALNIFSQSDPLASCTGGRIRLNALVKFATETNNYYKLVQAPQNKDDFAETFGIAPRKELSPGTNGQERANKILIMKEDRSGTDSGVALANQRIAEFQRVNRFQVRDGNRGGQGYCFGSYDFIVDGDQRSGQARDVTINGVLAAHDAEEWLCPPPNGFSWRRYLFNKAGQIQTNAPGNIVKQNINAGLTCLDCHSQITLGGGEKTLGDPNNPEQYNENLNNIPTHHRQFFTSKGVYKERADRMKQLMLNNQCNAGALIYNNPENAYSRPLELLPRIAKQFDLPLSEVEAARELGLPDNAFRGRFSGAGFTADNKISREVFETMACQLKAEVTGQLPSSRPPRTAPTDNKIHR